MSNAQLLVCVCVCLCFVEKKKEEKRKTNKPPHTRIIHKTPAAAHTTTVLQ
jgi:hypothetical protein